MFHVLTVSISKRSSVHHVTRENINGYEARNLIPVDWRALFCSVLLHTTVLHRIRPRLAGHPSSRASCPGKGRGKIRDKPQSHTENRTTQCYSGELKEFAKMEGRAEVSRPGRETSSHGVKQKRVGDDQHVMVPDHQ